MCVCVGVCVCVHECVVRAFRLLYLILFSATQQATFSFCNTFAHTSAKRGLHRACEASHDRFFCLVASSGSFQLKVGQGGGHQTLTEVERKRERHEGCTYQNI